MDILEIAANSGMQVTLDGRIGREEYRSVYGSVQALQRFADALLASVLRRPSGTMTKSATTLEDKYLVETGRVFTSSNQALVRLPLDQARRDRRAGIATTGYISGYRGSPLGVYDAALWGAQKLLDQHAIRFQPGLNEELAATPCAALKSLIGSENHATRACSASGTAKDLASIARANL